MLTKYVADMMTAPAHSPVFGNPGDLGMTYEDVTFKTTDGVTLSGWLIDGGHDRLIIQTHFGVQCSRSGYTPEGKGMIKLWDREISFLRQAKHLVENGYSVLMYDMRHHGDSGPGTRDRIAWGSDEARDVIAAVDFITRHPVHGESAIGLLSICMGTSATVFAYGLEDGLSRYKNIKAMVSIQPLRYMNFTKAMGIPDFLSKRANRYNMARGGADLSRSFFEHAPRVPVPTLVVQNQNDPWTDLDSVEKFHDLLGGEKEMLWLDLSKKRAAAYDWLGERPQDWAGFFARHLSGTRKASRHAA